MRAYRTVLEQKIRERRLTFEEFAEYAETYAREHREPGTLSVRHLQRLAAGARADGRPLGPVRPATARLLERIFGLRIDELLSPPDIVAPRKPERPRRPVMTIRQEPQVESEESAARPESALPFEWLDERAGWISDTSRRKVASRLTKVDAADLLDRHVRRARVARSAIADALSEYYPDPVRGYDTYRVRYGQREVRTTILTRPDWLDVACPLTADSDRLELAEIEPTTGVAGGDLDTGRAVRRLVEAAVLDVRVADALLYRLLDVEVRPSSIAGSLALAPFSEYALTFDVLETELTDAVLGGVTTRSGSLPLRERYLPDVASVLDISERLCVGGALALCAVARLADPVSGEPDYALLVQERSRNVVNGASRLSVIPKGFHQPLADVRADTRIGATLLREMEEELFGRGEVDSTAGKLRIAAPMHPRRLSEPMRWLVDDPNRLRMECAGFGLNLVSGNYEFASLVVVEDDEFWLRFGGDIEANWEASGLRVYSSLDDELIDALVADESWSNEGLFAFLQGIRRLGEIGGSRVRLSAVEFGGRSC